MDKQELGKILEQFILRFEREPKNDPELSWFHKFDSKGKVTGVRDMEIVDYIVENVSFFVRGEIPYYYEHGVFIEDTKGVKLKYRIQKLIYRDQVNSSTIQRVYNLLITQPQIYRNSYELNKQPAHWINFRNAYYDVLSGELIEHDPKYMTINQIPFPYYPAYTGGRTWIIRILAIIVVFFILAIVTLIITEGIRQYEKMWDEISQMFLVGSLSGISVLGDAIREYLPVNLILLFGFVNTGIMLLKMYFRKKFDYM